MPKAIEQVFIQIDNISINATHYGAMPEKEAVKKMIEDGNSIPGDKKQKEEWAKNAYKLISPKESPAE